MAIQPFYRFFIEIGIKRSPAEFAQNGPKARYPKIWA
jgi:hypothetical protein